ncbi:Histidine kinase-, DNA gyrase B-, and HSP90-like ATPase [Hymenobacter daecheongensis DSM 21074]|uniref:histidine kinase n=1 Tax=Hymenobacter daecheongensis DSM 21074 TaxID=1121955 RepID=A0A1M6CW97_9BACT|nr:Histidine kinase-, DNA gyrase B-, and HSP90-like ATPase [Hymenobacter daecheongensis DSM 21074]
MDTFVYTASHDLKAPITNIEGLLSELLQELPPPTRVGEVSHILALMQDSVDRFKLTIGHLTSSGARSRRTSRTMAASAVALAAIVRDVRLDLAPLLARTAGQLTVEVQDCATLTFSEKNLRSVVYNLLSNALKYHHPARVPRVSIRCRAQEQYWALEVQDNGLGVPLSPERPLFALFQRFHTHVEGSGVGLYMVKKMLENAGGRIEVQSQLGVGSTFTAYFRR